jgi:hypothetical protein
VGATATLPCPPLPLLLSAAISAETELHGRRSRAVAPAGEFFLTPAPRFLLARAAISSQSVCVQNLYFSLFFYVLLGLFGFRKN